MNKFLIIASITALLALSFFISSQNQLLTQEVIDGRPSIHAYVQCTTRNCQGMLCQPNDAQCNSAAHTYGDCYAKTEACRVWEGEYTRSSGDLHLTNNYYDCQHQCQPDQMVAGNYYNIWACTAKCGGALVPTIYDYTLCRNTKCVGAKAVCPKGDKECQSASNQYVGCSKREKICQQSEFLMNDLGADMPLPPEYYGCDQTCRPKKVGSGAYYGVVYGCKAECGGISLEMF